MSDTGREGKGGAVAVAAGILASRILGLVRQKVFNHYLGAGLAADAFNVAFRIPNVLQNLFGEGVLSASFIPVYARLRAGPDEARRREVAGVVFGVLALGVAVLALAGVLAAPAIVSVLAPGFSGDQRLLTIRIVRILFPGAGLLVLSAWCLGVLNTHGRFLLSYASPVAWNLAMITALVGWGGRAAASDVVVALAWASVVGSVVQLGVQWPSVQVLLGEWRPRLRSQAPEAATVFRNFWPVFVGRGVTQLSGFVDVMVASTLVQGSASMLANAQAVYMLPVSLFGMSVSAAALPGLSTVAGDASDEARRQLRHMLDDRLRQVAFFVVPSAMALMALGPAIIAILFQGGAFGDVEAEWQRWTLAAAGLGLLGATLGRLYSTTLYALHDTRTPQRAAISRVVVAATVGVVAAKWGVPFAQLPPRFGIVALLTASSLAAWLEWALLRSHVARRLGSAEPAFVPITRVWVAAILAASLATAVAAIPIVQRLGTIWSALLTLAAFGAVYLGAATWLRVPQAQALRKRLSGG